MRRAVSKIIPSIPNKFLSGTSEYPEDLKYKIDFNSVDDFYISLDSPHKSWLPGDEISGQIILITKKNLANIVITLSLIGYVKINASSHSKLRAVKQSLFNHTIKIYGDDQQSPSSGEEFTNGLYKGEHRFPFIVKLPNKRIFTSIDFGKGSINYLLKASIGNSSSSAHVNSPPNQPNSDSSTYSAGSLIAKTKHLKILHNSVYTSEKVINLINPIDVGKLPPPKPKRLVIRGPRNTKKLARTHSSSSTVNTIITTSTLSSNNSDSATPGENNNNNNASNNSISNSSTPCSNQNSSQASPLVPIKSATIKVSLEIPKRGYLRGESIPIKLSISHLKKIQDLNGIIITFVRVCRLDNGPDGLYESFRKDLQQSIIPLYVDPNTFQSEINTSVRVPADAFPTISGCPLVSFQYFIEVLINLSGKSITLDNNGHPKQNVAIDKPNHHSILDSQISGDFKFNFNLIATSFDQKERSGFINTDKYKRMNKFLQLTTEVIIGTYRRGPGNDHTQLNTVEDVSDHNNSVSPLSRRSSLVSGSNGSPAAFSQSDSSPAQQLGPLPIPIQQSSYNNAIPEPTTTNTFSTPPYFEDNLPIPIDNNIIPNYDEIRTSETNISLISMPSQPQLSEKDQIKAYESSLLPSEPPLGDEEDNEAKSQIDRTNTILENIEESDVLSNTNTLNCSQSTSINNSQFQYFTSQTSSATITTPIPNVEGENEDDLYRSSINSANESADDQYSAIEYVPNYESVANDPLILQNSNISTGTDSNNNNGNNTDNSHDSIY